MQNRNIFTVVLLDFWTTLNKGLGLRLGFFFFIYLYVPKWLGGKITGKWFCFAGIISPLNILKEQLMSLWCWKQFVVWSFSVLKLQNGSTETSQENAKHGTGRSGAEQWLQQSGTTVVIKAHRLLWVFNSCKIHQKNCH